MSLNQGVSCRLLFFLYTLTLLSTEPRKTSKNFSSPQLETKIASSFEEILLRGETQTSKKTSRLTMEQSIKLKCSIQLKSPLMTSDKCIVLSVPQHTYLNAYHCNTEYQMFAWELWLHLNQIGSVFNEKTFPVKSSFLKLVFFSLSHKIEQFL